MAVATKNGVARALISTYSAVAIAAAAALSGETIAAAPPPSGGTPTAPTIVTSAHNEDNITGSTAVSVTGVQAGDLILTWGTIYADLPDADWPTCVDSVTGDYLDTSNTYAPAHATGLTIEDNSGEYMTMQAWSAVAQANAATLHLRLAYGYYRAFNVVVVRGQALTDYFDDGGTRPFRDGANSSSGVAFTVDHPNTTYSHCLILTGFGWYSSSEIATISGTYPMVTGRNDGDNNSNRLVTVGRTVTATGNYDPFVTPGGSTRYAAISFVIKGRDVA